MAEILDFREQDLEIAQREGAKMDDAIIRHATIQGQFDYLSGMLNGAKHNLLRATQREYPSLVYYERQVSIWQSIIETYTKLMEGETIGNDESLHQTLCLGCELPFAPKTSKGKFCSTRCRVSFHRKSKELSTNGSKQEPVPHIEK